MEDKLIYLFKGTGYDFYCVNSEKDKLEISFFKEKEALSMTDFNNIYNIISYEFKVLNRKIEMDSMQNIESLVIEVTNMDNGECEGFDKYNIIKVFNKLETTAQRVESFRMNSYTVIHKVHTHETNTSSSDTRLNKLKYYLREKTST